MKKVRAHYPANYAQPSVGVRMPIDIILFLNA